MASYLAQLLAATIVVGADGVVEANKAANADPRIFSGWWQNFSSLSGLGLTVIGFVVSLYGLYKTYQQAMKAKTAAELAKTAADEAKEESQKRFQTHSVANSNRYLAEIRIYIEQQEWSRACMRFSDLAEQMAHLANVSGVAADAKHWNERADKLRQWSQAARKQQKTKKGAPGVEWQHDKWELFLPELEAQVQKASSPFAQLETTIADTASANGSGDSK